MLHSKITTVKAGVKTTTRVTYTWELKTFTCFPQKCWDFAGNLCSEGKGLQGGEMAETKVLRF